MSSVATRLATLATCSSALLVLVLYAPNLQAPFLVPKFAALELTSSLGFLAFALRRATASGRRPWTVPTTVGALAVLGAALLAWIGALVAPFRAPYAMDAVAHLSAFFGLACGVSTLDTLPGARQRVLEAVTIGAGVVAAIGIIQHFEVVAVPIPVISTPGSTFGNRNMAAEAMAMALPLGLTAAPRARAGARHAMVGALALELVFLAVTRARGAWFGATLGLGAAVFIARKTWSRASIVAGLAVVTAAVVAAAVPGRVNSRDAGDSKRYSRIGQILGDVFDTKSPARKTRFGLWRRTLVMAREHPLLGVGPGNWPIFFPHYAEPDAAEDGVLTATLAPRQAHDDLLQWAAETGSLGLIALGILLVGTTLATRQRLHAGDEEERATTAGAAGALVAVVAMSLTSFPFEMPGTLALGGLAFGIVVVDPRGPARPAEAVGGARYALALAAGLLVMWAAVRVERSFRASRWLGVAERSMRADGDPAETHRDLQNALSVAPGDFRARLRMAQLLLREHLPRESGDEARQALATEPYSPNGWAQLAAAELEAGEASTARRDATQALRLLQDYPFALQLRMNAAELEGDHASAQTDRLHLATLATSSSDRETSTAANRFLDAGK